MKKILFTIVFICFSLSGIYADAQMYFWTDENGIRHFSNDSPPQEVEKYGMTHEEIHDESADMERMEREREWQEKESRRIEDEKRKMDREKQKRADDAKQREAEAKAEAEKIRQAEEQKRLEKILIRKKRKKRKPVLY